MNIALKPTRCTDYFRLEHLRKQSEDFLRPWSVSAPPDMPSYVPSLTMLALMMSWRRLCRHTFSYCVMCDGHLAGQLMIMSVERGASHSATLGYWVASSYAQQGVMTQALSQGLEICFHELFLHRVEANVCVGNIASERLLEKHGFQCEGIRQGFLYVNGTWRDHKLYALCAENYRP